jgi:hypothetical protein
MHSLLLRTQPCFPPPLPAPSFRAIRALPSRPCSRLADPPAADYWRRRGMGVPELSIPIRMRAVRREVLRPLVHCGLCGAALFGPVPRELDQPAIHLSPSRWVLGCGSGRYCPRWADWSPGQRTARARARRQQWKLVSGTMLIHFILQLLSISLILHVFRTDERFEAKGSHLGRFDGVSSRFCIPRSTAQSVIQNAKRDGRRLMGFQTRASLSVSPRRWCPV